MEVEIYAPRGTDPQTPHTRDELYVVVSGSGTFVNGPDRHPFGPGDVLFVPASSTASTSSRTTLLCGSSSTVQRVEKPVDAGTNPARFRADVSGRL